jgi:hypothetical protein
MATTDFTKNEWKSGDVLTADKLNNTDNGVANAIAGVQALESATALTDSQSGIAADALTPNNSTIPYAVGDIVMDGTTKKIFEITNVSEGTATIGAALVTLP